LQGQVSASLDNTSEVNWKKKTAASTFNLYKALDAFTMVMNILGKTFYVHVSHFQICLWRFASFALLFYKLALFTLARGGPNKANGCQLHYTWHTNCRLSSQIKKTNNHRRCHQILHVSRPMPVHQYCAETLHPCPFSIQRPSATYQGKG